MFCGYYRKTPYRPGLRLGPVGGYGGMFAPDWMIANALEAAARCRPFNCQYPCVFCSRRPGQRPRRFRFR